MRYNVNYNLRHLEIVHILLCIFELHVSLPSVVASLSHHLTAGLVVKAGSGQVTAHLVVTRGQAQGDVASRPTHGVADDLEQVLGIAQLVGNDGVAGAVSNASLGHSEAPLGVSASLVKLVI